VEIEETAIRDKNNQISQLPEEEIATVEEDFKIRMNTEEDNKEDIIITQEIMMEDQEEGTITAIKMEITIAITMIIEANQEEEEDIEVDIKTVTVKDVKANTNQDNKILTSKRETILISHKHQMMQESNSAKTNNKMLQSEETEPLEETVTTKAPITIAAIIETITIETTTIIDNVITTTTENTSQKTVNIITIEITIIAINKNNHDLLKILPKATPIETRNLIPNFNKKNRTITPQITSQKEEDAGPNQVSTFLDVR
jgi:hypothetical protein